MARRVVNAAIRVKACPGRSAARSGALQTRDRYRLRMLNGPGSAVHRFALHRIRDTKASLPGAPRAHLRHWQPEILPQRGTRVFLAKHAAALQLRHHEPHETLKSAGHVRRGNDEAVAGALDEPLLEPVRDFARAADDRIVHAAAPADLDEVAHGRIFLAA